MNRSEWRRTTDKQTLHKRAGGRCRYNAMRRRKAEARRAKMAEMFTPLQCLLSRGLAVTCARIFGVHRSTAWRDLQQMFLPPQTNFVDSEGHLLYTVTRAYKGGRILSIEDAEGCEIHGPRRREIVRELRCRRW